MPKCFVCTRRNASFRFPKEDSGVELWVAALGLQEGRQPTYKDRICEDHFLPSDWKVTDTGRKILKPGVFPVSSSVRADEICDEGSQIDEVAGQGVFDIENGNYSLDGLVAFLVFCFGTILICFLPFLLFWLSTRPEENPPPTSERRTSFERETRFKPVTLTGDLIEFLLATIFVITTSLQSDIILNSLILGCSLNQII